MKRPDDRRLKMSPWVEMIIFKAVSEVPLQTIAINLFLWQSFRLLR